nr:MAG TPA: hypothetical protein [Bacteriophage sp.]
MNIWREVEGYVYFILLCLLCSLCGYIDTIKF